MRRLICPNCEYRTFFQDTCCLHCGWEIGYRLAEDEMFVASDFSRCTDHNIHGCNWLVTGDADGTADQGTYGLCRACSLDLNPSAHAGNSEISVFKADIRRVVRQLQQWGIDPASASPPLRFDLRIPGEGESVIIGHEHGLVTLDAMEADPVQLEASRTRLGEPYRTPLGHVRHESGHWHWEAFVESDPDVLAGFRELFGDETADYAQSLEKHYGKPDDGSWKDDYLSHYAAAHPWEDYAESFAHVLHMSDTMETAQYEGMAGAPYGGFSQLYAQWVEVTVSLNELSRSMGVIDPYPFAPSPRAVDKLKFVYDLLNS